MANESLEPKVEEIIEHWNRDESNLIEMLQDIQEHFSCVPYQVAEQLSDELDVSMNRIFHIVTFYKGFTLEPRGKYPVSVCTGTACHVKGGTRILENIMRDLGLEREGQATSDLLFSAESVRCLGCCGLAPVVTVGGEVYGDTSSVKVSKILDRIRKSEKAH
jgi:NADH:ubiquinone oxidoreductase subunit E